MKKEWVLSKDEVKEAFNNGQLFLDIRTDDHYVGLNRHPKVKAIGTIPGSRNVPQDWLTIGGKGQITPKAAEHPPVAKLIEDGDLEITDPGHSSAKSSASGGASVQSRQAQGGGGGSRRSGDR